MFCCAGNVCVLCVCVVCVVCMFIIHIKPMWHTLMSLAACATALIIILRYLHSNCCQVVVFHFSPFSFRFNRLIWPILLKSSKNNQLFSMPVFASFATKMIATNDSNFMPAVILRSYLNISTRHPTKASNLMLREKSVK